MRLLFSLAAGLTEGSSLLLSSLSSAGGVIYITPTGLTVIAALTVETRITPARVQRLLTAGRAVTAAGGTVSVLTGPAATIARAFRDAMSDTRRTPGAFYFRHGRQTPHGFSPRAGNRDASGDSGPGACGLRAGFDARAGDAPLGP
ncbi:MAG: hypothetical protein V8R49_08900 [Duodenibacillus massiliensis]